MSILKRGAFSRALKILLLTEGLAVGALVHGGVALVGAYQDAVQSAVVDIMAVIGALMNSTFNALVCVIVHNGSSFFGDGHSMPHFFFCIHLIFIDICIINHYNIRGKIRRRATVFERKEKLQ